MASPEPMIYRGEVLQPGASNPGDAERDAERRRDEAAYDAYAESRRTGRWHDPDTGVKCDVSPHDAPPSQPMPPGMTARERWQAGAGNPWRTAHPPCVDCGATLTYVGHVDDIPNEPRCRTRCRRPLPYTADAHTPPKP